MRRFVAVALAVTFAAGCSDAHGPAMGPAAPLFSHMAGGDWNATADMSQARHFLAAAAVAPDGKVYVSGGLDASGLPVTLVEAYMPAEDRWTAVASLPEDRFTHASALGGDGRIYAIGGITGGGATLTNTVASYDVAADSWTAAPSMTVVRGGPAAAAADGKIYVTGGLNEFDVESSGEVFDPATRLWSPIASMATARHQHAMATGSDGLIYAIGGSDASGGLIAAVEAYNPATGEWTPVASLPAGRIGLGAATAGDGHVYAYGGWTGGSEVESSALTLEDGEWKPAPSMNQARTGFAATAGPDGRIYAIGGVTIGTGSLSSAEWRLPRASSITVAIVIKPRDADDDDDGNDEDDASKPARINRESKGTVPVALLSSSTFDARTADRSTVRFAGAPALRIGGGAKDVNGDGLPDVVFHFLTRSLELPDGTTVACMTGRTTAGTSFQGCDAVHLVK